MGRIKDPRREKAFQIWQNSGGGVSIKKIAGQIGVAEGTVRVWKNRDKWSLDETVTLQNKKRNVTKKSKHSGGRGPGPPDGNKNAVGNNGGPPPRNHNAVTHGLYAKYLPEETLELARGFRNASPIDLLWDAICIKYAAIIRAQPIMHVRDKEEIIEHIKSESDKSTTYEFQFAWDRQAAFLNAQSKAMATLNNLIKQYDELCRSDLATEEQRLRVEKLKTDIEINRKKIDPAADGADGDDATYINALDGKVAEVWDDAP